jgi:hypothetical protein
MHKKDFFVRIPARLLKDQTLSGDARLLRAVIGAYADGKTGIPTQRQTRDFDTLIWPHSIL